MRYHLARRAFTLIELLVVIAVIAVLIALLLPAVQKVREAANRTQCTNNVKQLGIALHSYHDVNKRFPPAGKNYGYGASATTPIYNLNGLVTLLPYIEQDNLYRAYDSNAPSGTGHYNFGGPLPASYAGGVVPSAANITLAQTKVPTFRCPSETSTDRMPPDDTYYGINATQGGEKTNYDFVVNEGCSATVNYWLSLSATSRYMFGENSNTRIADVTDGTTNTLAMSEMMFRNSYGHAYGSPWAYRTPWGAGVDPAYAPINTWGPTDSYTGTPVTGVSLNWMQSASLHPGGANFLMADASVQFISQQATTAVLANLSTMQGGTVTPLP